MVVGSALDGRTLVTLIRSETSQIHGLHTLCRWCIYSNLFGRYKVNGAALNRGWLRAFDACPGQTNASIVENLGALRKKIIDGAGLTAVVKRFTTLVDLAAQDFIDNMVLVYK